MTLFLPKRFYLLFLSFYFFVLSSAAQSKEDSIPPPVKRKFVEMMYVRALPVGIYTGAGYPKDRISQNLEIGRTFGMIDAGLAFGRTALRRDNADNGTDYLEAKITMDLCQFGIFPMK